MNRPSRDASRSTSRPLLRSAIVPGMCWILRTPCSGCWRGSSAARSVRACTGSGASWPWGRGGALTLGKVILHTGERLDTPCPTYAHRAGHGIQPSVSLDDHERAHVYQYMLFGPL